MRRVIGELGLKPLPASHAEDVRIAICAGSRRLLRSRGCLRLRIFFRWCVYRLAKHHEALGHGVQALIGGNNSSIFTVTA